MDCIWLLVIVAIAAMCLILIANGVYDIKASVKELEAKLNDVNTNVNKLLKVSLRRESFDAINVNYNTLDNRIKERKCHEDKFLLYSNMIGKKFKTLDEIIEFENEILQKKELYSQIKR